MFFPSRNLLYMNPRQEWPALDLTFLSSHWLEGNGCGCEMDAAAGPKGQQVEAAVTFSTPLGQFPREERSKQQLQLWRRASIQDESLCSLLGV